MKILTKGNRLDLEAPIYMDDQYFEDFCKFLSDLIGKQVEVVQTKEKERYVGEAERHPVKWKAEDLFLLLSPLDHDELTKRLKRSNMSVLMRQGEFVPQFMAWARKKGFTEGDITVAAVNKYLEENEQ